MSFKGVLDGNNFKIKNLKINRPSEEYVGLFSSTHKSLIKNIGLVDYDINGGYCVGGFVGLGVDEKILNSYSSGSIQLSEFGLGGLVGCSYGGEYIQTYSLGDIRGESYVGGLVGYFVLGYLGTEGDSLVKNSYSLANVTGSGNIGGIIGAVESYDTDYFFELSNSYFKGEVNSTGSSVGGLIGYADHSVIRNNYSNSIILGNSWVGGLVGNSQTSSFENNYSIGSVSGVNKVGGLVGAFVNSSAKNNFATIKTISTNVNVGGLFGQVFNYNNGLGPLINNYFDETLTGQYNCYTVNEAGNLGYDGCNKTYDYNSQYFYKENAPLSSWTFKTNSVDGNWIVREKDYPVLAFENIDAYIDTTPPVVNLISPQNGVVLKKFFANLKFSVYDSERIKSCTIKMGSLEHTLGNPNSGEHEITWPIEVKNYDWNVSCTDWANNNSQLKSGSFSMAPNQYSITDCVGLQNIKNDLSGTYTLMNNIDCSSTRTLNGGLGFEPIGIMQHCELSPEERTYVQENNMWVAYSNRGACESVGGVWHDNNFFEGSFIANGKSITGLYINRPDLSGVGLFGASASRVNFQGVNMIDVNVIGYSDVGGVVGRSEIGSFKSNFVSGELRAHEGVGGLAGSVSGDLFENNTTQVKVISIRGGAGGLVGGKGGIYVTNITLKNNHVNGEVLGVYRIGGLIGDAGSGEIYCYNNSYSGIIKGLGSTGGLIGSTSSSSSQSKIIGNYVNASIYKGVLEGSGIGIMNDPSIGGLIGAFGQGLIMNNYAQGFIEGEGVENVGGLIGMNSGKIINNYSSMDVSGGRNVGGLIGASIWGDVIKNNYSVGVVSGSSAVGGLVGGLNNPGDLIFQNNYYLNGESCVGDGAYNCTNEYNLEEFFNHSNGRHFVYYGDEQWDNNWIWSGYDLPKLYWQN